MYNSGSGPRGARGRILHALRPVLMVSLAALAFGILLRWHHARFEGGLIDSFQQYQLDAAQGIATSMEGTFDDTVKSLAVMATYPGILEGSAKSQAVLDSCQQMHGDILLSCAVLDARGRAIHTSPADAPGPDSSENVRLAELTPLGRQSFAIQGDQVRILLPIRGDAGGGVVHAVLSIQRLAAKCSSRGEDPYKSYRWAIDGGGATLCTACPLLSPTA